MYKSLTSIAVSRSGTDTVMSPYSYEYSLNRTIYLFGQIDDGAVMFAISQIRTLDSISKEDITLVINSPGGSVTAGKALIDAMDAATSDIRTECFGLAASMAAVILACGTKGKRTIHPHAEVMIHQPLAGIEGQASDISIMCDHLTRTKDELIGILAERTGQSPSVLRADTDRDNWLDAKRAVAYGICDKVSGGLS